ncbi:hypothetical protein [Mycolicibacterium fortuitum]|uniref:Transmembrane protein n=2 Tax=Mycolicibacterium fortuitum TaxID=1766 RepID=A0AAE4VGN4_MYCFO|nr:hypothetical protein [Mycolicibacterium fortuitum]MCV7137916.1 hypothetical protein [Mycolicibacterium fortuitum]MDV7194481.1 hypothetical protein [Mycolicibacterium fortuitum]MDV7207889.1 hypothetical protein [Mycolicibacterium fortuitum]MDV7229187.1 hypothetical protein [Mycolicibacterium fortuitum]MDV7260886.1 hypothetical protein [Mycolicibacterium fortuitum]
MSDREERQAAPVSFVDVWLLMPALAPLGFVALATAGAVPWVLMKIAESIATHLLPDAVAPVVILVAGLGGLWLGYRLGWKLFRTGSIIALLWLKGFSWKEFRTAEFLQLLPRGV